MDELNLVSPHTSAYVSMRQHTSAYVSIRQHTSAYVSIRQHTSQTWASLQALRLSRKKTEIEQKRGGKPEIALIKDFLASLKICVPVFYYIFDSWGMQVFTTHLTLASTFLLHIWLLRHASFYYNICFGGIILACQESCVPSQSIHFADFPTPVVN